MVDKLVFLPQCIVYDFDGVMTDNRVIIDQNGNEFVCVCRGDGYGVRMIKDKLKIKQIILSTEENPIVKVRAKKLNIPVIYNACDDKAVILKRYFESNGIKSEKTIYVGNDLNDREAMLLCGLKACPSDAEPEIKSICDYVFNNRGGYGVIRELYRMLSENYNEE